MQNVIIFKDAMLQIIALIMIIGAAAGLIAVIETFFKENDK